MNGFLVNLIVDAFVIYKPIQSHWFIDWHAAIQDAQFKKDKIGSDCHLEVVCLQSNTVVLRVNNVIDSETARVGRTYSNRRFSTRKKPKASRRSSKRR